MAFNGFFDEFSNSPVSTTFPTYLPLNLTAAATPLYWAFIAPNQTNVFSQNMQVITNSSSTNAVVFPNATYTSVGQSCYFFNSSDTAFVIKNFSGTTIISSVLPATVYLITLVDNSTDGGTWISTQIGAIISVPVDVSSLVDMQYSTDSDLPMYGGLAAIEDTTVDHPGTYLKVNMWTQDYHATIEGNYTQTLADRGTLLVNVDNSSFDYILLSAAEAGNGFIFSLNNGSSVGGGGTITMIHGTDSIDVPILNPGNSCSFISDGVNSWRSLGLGLNTLPATFVNVKVELAPGTNSSPPLSFVNDTSLSLGLFYDSTANSMQIVQSYPVSPLLTPHVLAEFYCNATYPNGLITLALQSTFNDQVVNINPLTNLSISTPTANITAPVTNITATTSVNFQTPLIAQDSISLYTLMQAYS